MLRAGFIVATLAAALPFAAAAQGLDRPGPAQAAPAPAAPAPAAPGPRFGPSGGRDGFVGVPGGGGRSGVNIGPGRGYHPQAGWSDPGWRGRHRHHHHYGRVVGPSVFFGSTFAAPPYYYDDRYYYDEPFIAGGVMAAPDEVAYCRRKYRSYDIRTGTYLNRDGNRYPCP